MQQQGTASRPTHYIAIDGSRQPFTVSHRVVFWVAGKKHTTRLDSIFACQNTIEVNALLGIPSILEYLGTMTVEKADRLYPAS